MFQSKLIIPKIAEFVNNFVLSYNRESIDAPSRDTIRKYKNMLETDAVSRFCVEIVFLYMFSLLGDYQHPSKRIRADVLGHISNCKGSWKEVLKRMSSAYWFGYSWSEVAVEDTKFNRKILSEIHTIDPSLYSFSGSDGDVKEVNYKKGEGITLDYNRGIHIVTGTDVSFDYLHGCGRCRPAMPYWELHVLMMPIIAIAGQRQATPILVKKTETSDDVVMINQDTGQAVMDEFGEPILIKKGWDAIQQLEAIGSAGVTAIDRDDELYQIKPTVAGDFLMHIIKTCEQYRMLSFLVPATVGSFSLSGLGDAGLAQTHLMVFKMMISSMLDFLTEEIIEQLFRPLIIYNFGENVKDFGHFEIKDENPRSLEIASIMISALGKGKVELEDITALNRIRDLMGLDDYQESLK